MSLSKNCAAFSMYHTQRHGKKYPSVTINILVNQFQTLNLGLYGASWFLKTQNYATRGTKLRGEF